ncbi:MAG: rRNA maturation RNAse YbeY, partial [Clostridia bacterium]|nr:rRNA maturation RNAse YbeY [Clostridia bacterium]
IHSVLHLLGYDHERSQAEDEIMCQKQKNILDILYGKGTLRQED